MRPWLYAEWIWTLTPRGRIYSENMKLMQNFTNKIMSERERQLDETGEDLIKSRRRKAFLDLLLEMKREGKLNIEDVREEVETFMFEVLNRKKLCVTFCLGLLVWVVGIHVEVEAVEGSF